MALNEINNQVRSLIDNSTLGTTANKTGNVSLTANTTNTINALTFAGAGAVAGGSGGGVSFTGAGVGAKNTVGNTIEAGIKNNSNLNSSGNIALTATDTSSITSDAGAGSLAIAGGSGGGGSIGASVTVSLNDITNQVRSYVDNSNLGSSSHRVGNVTLTATENATIDAFALSGSIAGAGGSGGGMSFTGAGTGAINNITNTVEARINNTSNVCSSGAVNLNATDTSKIKIDAGAVGLAIAGGAGGGGSISVGVGIARNNINNTVRSYVDNAVVNSSGALGISAIDNATIETFAIGGAVAIAGGGGGGVTGAGSGAEATNTITNTVEAYIRNNSTVNTGGNLSLNAQDTSNITTRAIGGSLSIAGGGGGSAAIAIGVVIANNNIGTDSKRHTVRAYIGSDGNVADTTTVNTTGAISLTANSNPTLDTLAVAASASIAASAAGAALSGSGASLNNNFKTTTSAVIQNGQTYGANSPNNTVRATGAIALSATETPNVTSKVGAGAIAIGFAGASIGVSQIRTTIDSRIDAYIDKVKVQSDSGLSRVNASSNAVVNDLSVATSIAISLGGAGAGADAVAVTNARVNAYIGSTAIVNANHLEVKAVSNENLKTETYGIGGGLVAVGVAIAHSTNNAQANAYLNGNVTTTGNATVQAEGRGTTEAKVTAIAAGLLAGAGNNATARFNANVNAYVGTTANLDIGNILTVNATVTPRAISNAFGVNVGAVSVGVSESFTYVSPRVNAYINTANTGSLKAGNLTVLAQQTQAGVAESGKADADASGGALVGVNASIARTENTAQINAYVGNNSTLNVDNTIDIKANSVSKQRTNTSGIGVGIVAVGANNSATTSNITTNAYLGDGVNIANKAGTSKAGNFNLQAIGNNNDYTEATAGGGGIVSGRGAEARTNSTSNTTVSMGSGNVRVSNALVSANNNATFNSKTDAINASIAGGSGAGSYNNVNADVTATFGSDLILTADNLTANALNNISKPQVSGVNAQAGSGGVVDGSAVLSRTNINNRTKVIVSDRVTLNVVGTDGLLSLGAQNNLNIIDRSKIETGGAITSAGAESVINNNTNEAKIEIGNATLNSKQDIDIATRVIVNLDAKAEAKTWGLAGAPTGISLAETNIDNKVHLKTGANINASGNINISTGRSANNGLLNNIALKANTLLFNGTLATFSNPQANSRLTFNNKVLIDAGVNIKSAQDINVAAEKGFTTTEARGVGRSIGGEAIESIADFLGADNFSLEFTGGSTSETVDSGVTINGNLLSGDKNQLFATITSSLGLSVIDENNNPVTLFDSSNNPINDAFQLLITKNLIAEIDAELARINNLLTIANLPANQRQALEEERDAQTFMRNSINNSNSFIQIPNLVVSSGDINVSGDYLVGSGSLTAKGDSKIEVTNHSHINLLLSDLIVLDGTGGKLRFNNAKINSSSDIRNQGVTTPANFTVNSSANQSSSIKVENTSLNGPLILLEQNKTIQNTSGSVTLINPRGSIGILGEIRAQSIDISAGENFFLQDGYRFDAGGDVETLAIDNQSVTPALSGNNSLFDYIESIYGTSAYIPRVSSFGGRLEPVAIANPIRFHDDHLYFQSIDKVNWNTAVANANALGGSLLTINDQDEQNFLNAYFTHPAENKLYWTGLHDANKNNLFTWQNGEAFSYQNWHPGEPNNIGTEDAVIFNWDSQGSWGNSRKSDLQYAIYEIPFPTIKRNQSKIDITGDVFISAEFINVNGLIRSGDKDYTLTLDSGLNSTIESQKQQYYSGIPVPRSTTSNTWGNAQRFDIGDKAYFITAPTTWELAQYRAQQLGGNLVSINDVTEYQYLIDSQILADYSPQAGETRNFWIGLNDRNQEGTFQWSSGETADYLHWGDGEPNAANSERDFGVLNLEWVYESGLSVNEFIYNQIVTETGGLRSRYQSVGGSGSNIDWLTQVPSWRVADDSQLYPAIIEVPNSGLSLSLTNPINSRIEITNNLQSNPSNVRIFYDAASDQVEVAISAKGGFVQLVGQISSTGDGKIEALDGFTNVTVNNQTNYTLAVNNIDTGGDGIEGKVVIVDKSKSNQKTTITRNASGNIITNVNGVDSGSLAGRNTSYNPLSDLMYFFFQEGDLYTYDFNFANNNSTVTGSQNTRNPNQLPYLALSPHNPITYRPTTTNGLALLPDLDITLKSNSPSYVYKPNVPFIRYSNAKESPIRSAYSGDGSPAGSFDATYNFNSLYKADWQIPIEFIGYDQGTIDVTSNQNIVLNDSIINRQGVTNITSNSGSITQTAGNVIEVQNLNIQANKKIGTSSQSILLDVQGGYLEANAIINNGVGDIYLEETNGNLTVKTLQSRGNVYLTADGDIVALDSNSLISGDRVKITSTGGAIGSNAQALKIDSGNVNAQDGLVASAATDIYLQETTGDLDLITATSSTGNININVPNGSILDKNNIEVADRAAIANLVQTAAEQLRLTDAFGAQTAITEEITNFERTKVQEYQRYWQYRNVTQNADGTYSTDAYDPNYQFSFDSVSRTQLENNGWTTTQITDEETRKTLEYQNLHQSLDAAGLTTDYDPNYSYTADVAEVAVLSQGGVWTTEALDLAISPGLLLPVSDTDTRLEADNITGSNVTLNAGSGIGTNLAAIVINKTDVDLNGLTQAQLLALLSAERSDIIYRDASGNEITDLANATAPLASIEINSVDDVDLTAKGILNATANGNVYLGSEKDLNLGTVNAANQDVRIKTSQGIYGNSTGQSLSLDGSDDRVSININVPETNFTHEMWIQTTDGNAGIFSVVDDNLGAAASDRHLYLSNGVLNSRVWNNEVISDSNSQNLADEQWHHIAQVVSATDGTKIYIDGNLAATGTKTQSDFDWQTHVLIGHSVDGVNDFFTGSIDEVRLWGKALTEAEIQANLNKTLTGGENNLLAYYTFNDGTAQDRTPNNYDGTLLNGATVNTATTDNVIADSLVIEAGTKDIGKNIAPIGLNLGSGGLTARAGGDINITNDRDLNVDRIFANNHVELSAIGNIRDKSNNQNINILSQSLGLNAIGGDIGTSSNPLEINPNLDNVFSFNANNVNLSLNIDTFVVDTLEDVLDNDLTTGDRSLREALAYQGFINTITFAPSLAGQTINLNGSELLVTDSLTIDGDIDNDGVSDITIDGGNNSRVFKIDDGTNNDLNVTLNGLTISGGSAVASGSGIYNAENLTLLNSVIDNNAAIGIDNQGTLTVNSSNFKNNSDSAISNSGTLTVNNSLFLNNSATDGGAIANLSGTASITQSIFSGNTATNNGGAIYNLAILDLLHNTINENNKGIYNTDTLNLKHNIVANSSGGADIVNTGTINVTGINLVEDGSLTNPDIINLDPNLDTQDNNHIPLSGSPAVNVTTDTSGLTTDIRGLTRNTDGWVDLGAVESDLLEFTVDTIDDVDNGDYSIGDRSLREMQAITPDGGTVFFSPDLANQTITLAGAEILIDKNLTIQGGDRNITIDANSQSRVFNINDSNHNSFSHVVIDGLTITGAVHNAIYNSENLTVRNSNINNNAGTGITDGGVGNSFLTIENTVLSHNIGGIYSNSINTVNISNSSLINNNWIGLNITVASDVTIDNSNISLNREEGISIAGNGTVNINDSTITNNAKSGIMNYTGDILNISRTSINNNRGGIKTNVGNTTVTDSTISNNHSLGGIFSRGENLTVIGSTISNNSGHYGGIFIGSGGFSYPYTTRNLNLLIFIPHFSL